MGQESETSNTPRKPLSVLDIWALGVGIVVCGQYFGWNAGLLEGGPGGMLVASLIVCLLFLAWVLTLAELSVAMPGAGGPLDYGNRAGGPWLGFLMAWSMLLECLFGIIATALAAAWYVAFLLDPEQPDSTVVAWAGLGTVVLSFLLHVWGVKEQSRAQILMTSAAILGLGVFWVVAGSNFSLERAWPRDNLFAGKGWRSVTDAVPFALWWLIIIEGAVLTADKTHEPHRSIPLGLVWAVVTAIGMIVLTLVLTTGAVPWREVTGDYPLGKVVGTVTGGQPGWLVHGFGVLALFGLLASYHGLLFSTSQQAFALGKAGYLPAWLGEPHPTRNTPVWSLLACSLTVAGFVVANIWYKDAIMVAILVAGLASLIWYILAMACLIHLRRPEQVLLRVYRAPLGVLLPVVVVLLSGFAIAVYPGIEHGNTVLLLAAALYALGIGTFLLRRVRDRPESGPDGSPCPRLDRLAGAALLAALLAVGWIAISACLPDRGRADPIEWEVIACVVVLGAALALVCAVAIAHTRSRDASDRVGGGR